MIVLTRSLVLWVEFWLMPFITGKIVNKSVVRKSKYDDVVKEREQYFDLYEEQRKNLRLFSKTIDEQTEQIKQKDQDLLIQSETISKTVRELDSTRQNLDKSQNENGNKISKIKQLDSSLEQLQKDYDVKLAKIEKYEHLFFDEENKLFYSSIDKFPPEVLDKVEELKKEKKWASFIILGTFIEKGGSIGGEVLSEMIEKDVAFERGSHEDLTPLGKVIWRYRKVFGAEI
jgi:predicted RNase H-like nuclease (RuvC/YqgF family)